MFPPFSYMAPSISRRKSWAMALRLLLRDEAVEQPALPLGAAATEHDGQPGRPCGRHRLDREHLVPGRPDETPERPAGLRVEGVDATGAAIGVESRRVLPKARQDVRRPDEQHTARERESARPAARSCHRPVPAAVGDDDLASEAVVVRQRRSAMDRTVTLRYLGRV